MPAWGAVVWGLFASAVLAVRSDGTTEASLGEDAAVARHVVNRGGGAALRTGFGLLIEAGARVIVTLDADGQHLPEEMERVVEPVVVQGYDVAYGSRVLGHAEPNAFARELGIAFFNWLVSTITRTKVTDCSNGYRAIRTEVLPRLVLRQEQFHTSEFLIESLKKGLRTTEVPITVARRHSGKSKKPRALRYGWGFANAIIRTWLRRSGHPVAVPSLPLPAGKAPAREPDAAQARASS